MMKENAIKGNASDFCSVWYLMIQSMKNYLKKNKRALMQLNAIKFLSSSYKIQKSSLHTDS